MLRLHRYFSDSAILQRNAEVKIKGYSTLPVVCSLSGGGYSESVEVQPVNNSFTVIFPPVLDAENIFVLNVKNGEQELRVNLRFGDVYITAGQSNMSYALGSTENAEEWLQRAKKCRISLINLVEPAFTDISEVVRPAQEQEDFIRDYSWVQGDSFELNNISAISVQTAVLLSEKKGVPVGIVHTAMGGLGVEAYLNRQTAENDEEVLTFLKDFGRYVSVEDYNKAGARNYSQLSGVWNEKIAPLKGFSFSGLVWYLGESSAWDFYFAKVFEKCMTLFINDVRSIFGQIPVVTIQIAPEYYPYGDKFGYLYVNEALTNIQSINGVVTVPIYDVEPRWLIPTGELYFHPIHPVNKAKISERVCDVLTGERDSFPEIESVVREGEKLVCKIKNLKKPLKEGTFNGFTVAGKDGKYYPAIAKARGKDEIEVFFEDVLEPCKLTYAFTQYQDFCNVVDDGAPLLPYRTDMETVGENYCFTPAFFVNGASEVYENCFGCNVGTCRKVSVWKKGEIYNSADVNIQYSQEGIRLSSNPTFNDFGLFGISPTICLSGHKNQLASYDFLTFTLKANAKCDFLGVVARASDGEVFRFYLYNGSNKTDAIPLSQNGKRISVSLTSGIRGDSAPVQFNGENAKTFVQLEFVFRAFNKAEVTLGDITFTKENKSEIFESVKQEALRGDINIQDMS